MDGSTVGSTGKGSEDSVDGAGGGSKEGGDGAGGAVDGLELGWGNTWDGNWAEGAGGTTASKGGNGRFESKA